MVIWLVVWNIFYDFPYIGNSNPNWLSYFSEGLKPPTSDVWWYHQELMGMLWECQVNADLDGLFCGSFGIHETCWGPEVGLISSVRAWFPFVCQYLLCSLLHWVKSQARERKKKVIALLHSHPAHRCTLPHDFMGVYDGSKQVKTSQNLGLQIT